jgi:hypothetical protein
MNRLNLKLDEIDFSRITRELPNRIEQKPNVIHITNIYHYHNTPMPVPVVTPAPTTVPLLIPLSEPTKPNEDTFLNRHPIINKLHEMAVCPVCAPNRPFYQEFAISGGILVLLAKVGGLI